MRFFIVIFSMVLLAAFYSAGFAKMEDLILLNGARCSDEPSEILWKYLLKTTRLTEKTAEFHNIYKKDCVAVFYDLDDDGVSEVVGTHYASETRNVGHNIIYILKKGKKGYEDICYRIFLCQNSPIYVLKNKTEGFHDLELREKCSNTVLIYVYSKNINRYINKERQKVLEKEFKERFF